MADIYTPVMRALVVSALVLATAMLMLVILNTARAAGALAIGSCGAFGEAFDFHTSEEARQSALSKCAGDACKVVTTRAVAPRSLLISSARVVPMAGARGRNSAKARTRRCARATATAARSA